VLRGPHSRPALNSRSNAAMAEPGTGIRIFNYRDET
jgi:hypothetical protein